MKTYGWLGAALLAGCGGPETSAPTGTADTGPTASVPPEPEALAGITAAHNAVRAGVGVAPMVWDEALADLASGFVFDCAFEHSSTAERSGVAGFDYVGENLYLSGYPPTGAQVSDAWASEEVSYNYVTNTCTAVCGHYTQMVWAESTALGCAIKECSGGWLVACEYGPGGNLVGERPY